MIFGGCEVRKRAKEMQQVRTEKAVSYADAVKMVRDRSETQAVSSVMKGSGKESGTVQSKSGNCWRVDKDTLIMNKDKFLFFMAEVINCAFQAERRSERIAIIVKSAARYLDIEGITWENIYGELKRHEQLSEDRSSQSQD